VAVFFCAALARAVRQKALTVRGTKLEFDVGRAEKIPFFLTALAKACDRRRSTVAVIDSGFRPRVAIRTVCEIGPIRR
jgi:hypothetical protein